MKTYIIALKIFISKNVTCEKLLLIYDLLTKSRSVFVRIILGLISEILLMYIDLGLRGCFSAFQIIYLFFKTMLEQLFYHNNTNMNVFIKLFRSVYASKVDFE
ncbi:hypothetical protein Hanom_Chr10g00916961 [Helianthus anomalus]